MPPRRFPSRASLANVASKRASLSLTAPNINHLVRVFMLDGSSKVLQATENSTVRDILAQMKYNMDLGDVSTCALFRVVDGQGARRMELDENMKQAIKETHELDSSGTYYVQKTYNIDDDEKPTPGSVRILFRTWIHARCGIFDQEVFQYLERHKHNNSALWLAYMESTFMCMTGRYYLSDDEAIMLGCLRMQADSGDFNPDVHTIDNIKERVCTRFPRPISTQMRALLSPTLIGNGMADALAERIMFLYARIAGKHKAEAQIEFLTSLRTWCPFYGATFFTIQCQYDDGQSEDEPPVHTMNVAIGPLAIFLITQTEPLIILRHPYKRIVKWIAYRDKHIFCYWVLKKELSLKDVEIAQENAEKNAIKSGRVYSPENDFDATDYCDCVYLVTPSCAELEYLVRSYVSLLKYDIFPRLKSADGDLLPPALDQNIEILDKKNKDKNENSIKEDDANGDADGDGDDEDKNKVSGGSSKKKTDPKRRKSRLGALFSALGGFGGSSTKTDNDDSSRDGTPLTSPANTPSSAVAATTTTTKATDNFNFAGGTGIGSDSGDEDDRPTGFGDDCAGASSKTNLFRNVYASPYRRGSMKAGTSAGSGTDTEDEAFIPPQIQFAASMSELQRLTTESFSDDEGDADADGEEDDSDESDSGDDGGSITSSKSGSVKITREAPASAFRRVSSILFGGGKTSVDKTIGAGSEVNAGSESEYETDSDSDSD
jgi:hypothetical protein